MIRKPPPKHRARRDLAEVYQGETGKDNPIPLYDGDIVCGVLEDIIETECNDIVMPKVAGEFYEVPRSLSASLWLLVGRRIWLANVGRKILATEVSEPTTGRSTLCIQ